jgi:hypothetical protein
LRLKLGSVWSTELRKISLDVASFLELRKISLDVISFLECASILDSLVFFGRTWSEYVSWSVGHVMLD